jgi:hypothetical protein
LPNSRAALFARMAHSAFVLDDRWRLLPEEVYEHAAMEAVYSSGASVSAL